jgi:hypothetical protein
MNDEFVKLAYESKLFDGTGNVPFDHVEKFAELIVRDCLARVEGCTIITTQQVQPVSEFNQGYDKAIKKVYSQVKLHFGVK